MIDSRFKVGNKYKVKGSRQPLIYIYSKDKSTGVFFNNKLGENLDVDVKTMTMHRHHNHQGGRLLHNLVEDEMKFNGLFIYQFAKEIGVSGQTLHRFLKAKSKPSKVLRRALAKYWDVPEETIEEYYYERTR